VPGSEHGEGLDFNCNDVEKSLGFSRRIKGCNLPLMSDLVMNSMKSSASIGFFPLAGLVWPSQVAADATPMTDPTELVMAGSFVLALGLFVISAVVRTGFIWKRQPIVPTDPVWVDEIPAFPPAVDLAQPPVLQLGKVPVWFYGPADLVGAFFVFLVFAGLFLMSAGAPDDAAVLKPHVLLLNIGFQFFIAGVVVIFAIRRVALGTWLGLRWASWHWVFLIAPGAVVFIWGVFAGLQYAGYMEWMESLGVETVQESVKLLQKSEDPLVLGLMTVAAVLVAPLCEEIVFRGYFYPVLKRFAGAWPAAICSAMVFAAAHGNLTALLPLFVFGGLLVFIYEKTGSIWAPIAVHFCFNSATVIVQFVARHYDLPFQSAP
jgi:membrane protease YdiL (CAAX protease family)